MQVEYRRLKSRRNFLKEFLFFSQYPKPKFSADGKYFINLLPKDEGSAGYFRHVAKVSTEVGEWSLRVTANHDPLWHQIRLSYYLKVVSGLNSLCLDFYLANKALCLTMGVKHRQR